MIPKEVDMNKHSNTGKKKSSEEVSDGLNLQENIQIRIKTSLNVSIRKKAT